MRCTDAGMSCVSMHDPKGRRGIWYRTETEATSCMRTIATSDGQRSVETTYPAVTKIEIVAGREGDDESVTLRVGDTITLEMLYRLEGCLRVGAWMLEESRDNDLSDCKTCDE